MKTKTTGSLFLYLLFSITIYAQDNDFNLADYRLPDFDYRYLESEFDLSSNNSANNNQSPFSTSNRILNSFSTGGVLNYFRIKNDKTWQKTSQANSSFGLSFRDDHNSSSNYKNSLSLGSRLTINKTNRKYILPNTFREINLSFLSTFNWEKEKISDNINGTESRSHSIQHRLVVPLKYGKGRIDQVTDARQAIYILDRLKEQGRLSRIPNKEEVKKFAEHISRINYRRYFDFRLRRIYELEKVDSFLQAHNFINTTDIKYFTHLNDMWVYGDDQIRFSGKRFSLVFYPGLSSFQSRGKNESQHFNESILSISPGLEYLIEQPINLFWQNTFEFVSYIGFAMGKQNEINTDNSNSILIPKFDIGATERLIFYPNTRTSLSYNLGLRMSILANNIGFDLDLNGLNSIQIAPNSSINFNYFLSPRLQLDIDGSVSYRWSKNFESSGNSSNFIYGNQRLSYLLFYPEFESLNILNYDFDAKRYSFTYRFNMTISYSLF